MSEEHSLKKLKHIAQKHSILFVEDNEKLREQSGIFLSKLFDTYYTAADGKEGLELFKDKRPDIVISDIRMPNMDGFEMIEAIREIDKDVMILISTAHQEISFLMRAIENEVFRYLSKPISVSKLSHALLETIMRLEEKEKKSKFKVDMNRIFNHQNSLICLLEDAKVSLANERFLHFFDVESEVEFAEKIEHIESIFLNQKEFFYPKENSDFMSFIMEDSLNVYNAKLIDGKNTIHHFILSIQRNFEDNTAILVLNDVTSLNLLPLFDLPEGAKREANENKKAVYSFVEQLFESGAKIQLHNTYKGLPITHEASLSYITDKKIGFTSMLQQIKAISLEEKTYLDSELLPQAILLNSIDKISMDNNEVIFDLGDFVSSSPMMRESIRLIPDDQHVVTLLQHDSKLPMSARINDISIKAISLSIPDFMETLDLEDVIQVDIVFTVNRQKVLINSNASIYKITKHQKHATVVCILSLEKANEKVLTQYLLKRQMELIREFKGRS